MELRLEREETAGALSSEYKEGIDPKVRKLRARMAKAKL